MSTPFDVTRGSAVAPSLSSPSEEKGAAEQAIWPTFFVVGAQKCGTTTLCEQLRNHPEVFVPARKEPDFFTTHAESSKVIHKTRFLRTLREYQEQFLAAGPSKAIGDFSTGYLWDPAVPAKIRECAPNAKIIIMLRDPVIRANSAYLMLHSRGQDTAPSLREAIAQDAARERGNWFTAFHYIDAGLYYDQVKRYLDTFGREQVFVGIFDDLTRKPLELFTRIAHHIGISAEPFASMNLGEAYNSFTVPRSKLVAMAATNPVLRSMSRAFLPLKLRRSLRHVPWLFSNKKPTLESDTRRYLQQIFEPDLVRLEQLLGRELPDLRSQWI